MNDPEDPSDRWDLRHRHLYLCTPDRSDLERFVEACIEGGVDIVQLREKQLPEGQLAKRAAAVQRICADHDVPFVLNDNPELAAAVGANGVHVGQDDMDPTAARRIMGATAILGLSTHAAGQLETALGHPALDGSPLDADAPSTRAPVDYISAGPVVATPTKPGRPGTGLGYVREAIDRAPWSVWISGGVDPDTVVDMIAAGARHFVVVRWLTEADDPKAHARRLRAVIDERLG